MKPTSSPRLLAAACAGLALALPLSAQTVFSGGDPLLLGNWSNGRPLTQANPGSIASGVTGNYSTGNVTDLTRASGGGDDAARITINGGSLIKDGTGTLTFGANGSVIVNSGSLTNLGGSINFNRSSLTVNGGSVSFGSGSQLQLNGTQNSQTAHGTFLITGGSVTGGTFNAISATAAKLFRIEGGSVTLGSGVNLSGGNLAHRLYFAAGGTGGNVTINGVANQFVFGTNGAIDWQTGSIGALSVNGYTLSTYQGLFSSGQLLFNGSNAGNFADIFSVTGNTLSLIPEPSAFAAYGGLAALVAVGMRRRRRA
jgi:hypothetical protein